ncbi:MAG: MBL fold metallo-hydrolase [Anaerolineae bacterium]|nr:MBL fold metallo-hydrolase [Anaerolineae bacterium]
MIEPTQSGSALLNDITSTQLAPGAVAIWWLGQSGYAIKTAATLFYIDLYLSEHLTTKYANTNNPHIRMTVAPLRGSDITNAHWLFASHKHSDHLDPGTMPLVFAASPEAKLVLPTAIIDTAVERGLDRARLIPTRGDETLQAGPFTVHSIPSAHETLEYTEESGYPYLGFVIQVDGLTLYHSGDTLVYDGLAERLRQHAIDIAFLPINGTSERLHQLKVAGNMNAQEAVDLAKRVGARLVIPHHYDMFTFNTADVRVFKQLADAAGVRSAILRCGEKFCWQR